MKRVLVTGGAGFVGSHLCERLLKKNYYVTCLDDYSTGNIDNISHLIKNKNFEIINQDICQPFYKEVDEIYNLACPASPKHYQSNAIKTIKTSVLGAINILELAKKTNAKALLTSTSEVYGDPLQHPQNESYWGNVNPIGVRACYDEGKRCAETLFMDYNRQHKVNTKIARIFNTYGTRMQVNDGRVVSNFIIQALQNKEITIYGSGLQTRSFQFIEDLINGLIFLMNSKDTLIKPVNIGNPKEFTIIELAEKIIKLTNSKSKIKFLPSVKDDPKMRCPNIELAKKELKWEPKIELDNGLISSINYFKGILEN